MSCGGNCQCASKNSATPDTVAVCTPPKEGIVFDASGKCPCGKSENECCHGDMMFASEVNEALDELCEPRDGVDICAPEPVSEAVEMNEEKSPT